MNSPITVAYGDGIGPEIMEATLLILKEAGAKIHIETIEVGEELYKKGITTGIGDDAWDAIKNNKVFLKAPITTPQGGGYKSLNVTIRRKLGLYANIRPSKSLAPYLKTNHPNMDLVIIRENEEGLYAGIEHRPADTAFESLKLLTKDGCDKINKFAFDYAIKNNRKKVTCMTKDNILKITDGAFHRSFQEIAKYYPKIENEHYIIDIGTARVANRPHEFDVVVTGNLYGDVISDVTAEISGSVGLAGSANIGDEYAMFEAIHGSAPALAGKDTANPSGLINGAVMMLVHLKQNKVAEAIENALLKTIEDGIHTKDVYNEKTSKKKVGTQEFAHAVIKNLGEQPKNLTPASYTKKGKQVKDKVINIETKIQEKLLVGVDISFEWETDDISAIAAKFLNICKWTKLKPQLIASRGLKVWPALDVKKEKRKYWQARFIPEGKAKTVAHKDIIKLLNKIAKSGIDFAKVQNLYTYDGELGFSLMQGQ